MSIWYIVLVIVMANGEATVDTRYPNTPQYNNEKDCNEVGEILVKEEQMRVGTAQGTVYFICKEITAQEQKAATTKGSGA
jgi:hypothetical protein